MKLDRRSLVLLLLQLAIVSSIAAKYLYQRQSCPRVWVRATAYDPALVFRGRYLSTQLHIDACQVKLPRMEKGRNPGNANVIFLDNNGLVDSELGAQIGVRNGKLVVTALNRHPFLSRDGAAISLRKDSSCSDAILNEPVDFYLPEHAQSPFPLKAGAFLWVEVTVPPKGPPRPINLAINDNGVWQPLHF